MQWKKKSKRRGDERGLTVGVLHGVGVGAAFPSMPWRPGARATTTCWMDLVARGDEVRKRGSGRDRRRGEEERGPTLVAGDTPTTRWTKPYPRETVARGRWSTRAPDLGGARGRRRASPAAGPGAGHLPRKETETEPARTWMGLGRAAEVVAEAGAETGWVAGIRGVVEAP